MRLSKSFSKSILGKELISEVEGMQSARILAKAPTFNASNFVFLLRMLQPEQDSKIINEGSLRLYTRGNLPWADYPAC